MSLANYIIAFIFLVYGTNSARILGIIQIPAHSHQTLGSKLLTELAARGHDVTLLSPTDPKSPLKNFKYVPIKYPALSEDKQISMIKMKEKFAITQMMIMDFLGLHVTDLFLSLKEIQAFLSQKQHFDAVIIEEFLNEAFRGFCYKYSAVCIGLSTVGPNRWTNRQMGNPANPAYVPELFLSYSDHMNFFQRVTNTIISTVQLLFNHYYVLPKHNDILQKYFPGAPHIYDLYYNTSLMLVNAHVSTNFPVPLVPNMIPIGGYHLKPPGKLPKDLQDYLDSATNGAIYFSMGSHLKSAEMGEEKINAILKVFGKLKQKVLWKWEKDTLPGLPPNVKLSTWFPQQEILDHPNTKLFITHGGLLSTIEAIYCGVPLIAIPIYGDQDMNAANAVHGGYAVLVEYEKLTEDTLENAVVEVLNNPKYRNIAQQRSQILQDDPIKPMDKAIFWIDYVIRYKGAPHLRSAALNLTWYQYLLLDVLLFISSIILVVLFVLKKIVSRLFRKKTSQRNDETKKNK